MDIWERYPPLTDWGFGTPEQFHIGRAMLLASEEEFAIAADWIQQNLRPIQRINYKHTSLLLVRIAEPEIGQVSNGTFIAAMLSCGYTYGRIVDNVYFNVSKIAVRRARGDECKETMNTNRT
jgi:hypothetical protein